MSKFKTLNETCVLIIFVVSSLFFSQRLWAEAYHLNYITEPNKPTSRIDMVREIDRKHGHVHEFCPLNRNSAKMVKEYPAMGYFGLFGGVFLNTYRQFQTKRQTLSIWNRSNSSLTVEPYHFMKDYEAGRDCKDSPFIKRFGQKTIGFQKEALTMSRVKACRSWHLFFEASDVLKKRKFSSAEEKGLFKEKMQRLLWNAHSLSLIQVWSTHKKQFEQDLNEGLIPSEEYSQWMSWNRFVIKVLPRINWSSCAGEMYPYLDIAMPYCFIGDKVRRNGVEQVCRPGQSYERHVRAAFFRPVLRFMRSLSLSEAIQSGLYELRQFERNWTKRNHGLFEIDESLLSRDSDR